MRPRIPLFLSFKASSSMRRQSERKDVSYCCSFYFILIYLLYNLVTSNIVEFFIERKGDPTNIQTLYTAAHRFSKREVQAALVNLVDDGTLIKKILPKSKAIIYFLNHTIYQKRRFEKHKSEEEHCSDQITPPPIQDKDQLITICKQISNIFI